MRKMKELRSSRKEIFMADEIVGFMNGILEKHMDYFCDEYECTEELSNNWGCEWYEDENKIFWVFKLVII